MNIQPTRFSKRINPAIVWLACGLTLTTVAVRFHSGSITYAGFPFTVFTYFDYPQTVETRTIWQTIISKVSIHLLDGLLNILVYYFALRWFYWLWQQGASSKNR